MPPKLAASRRSRIDPFIVMEVMAAANARAAAGGLVLHLEVGEPGLGPPRAALEAARAARAAAAAAPAASPAEEKPAAPPPPPAPEIRI